MVTTNKIYRDESLTGESTTLINNISVPKFRAIRGKKSIRAILVGLTLALLIALPVSAAPQTPSGTLTITSFDARFGGAVTFSATANNLKGYQYPLVYLACSQGAILVYGQLAPPTTTFILGGGSSPWYQSPGPASCTATLYAYPGFHSGNIIQLAPSLTFDAAG